MKYDSISKALTQRIEEDRLRGTRPNFAFPDHLAIRRREGHDKPSVWRNAFTRDVDKILHSAYYSRFADKTQVFSFYRNDDISRRALHVQLVSRIARTIGSTLNLNLDLIEAIALGHDMGHTPFGHAGEKYLDELYSSATGRHFAHNIHSARVLDGIYPYNITLQTLNGIIAHNGEMECEVYTPRPLNSFEEFDRIIEGCYADPANCAKVMPSTLEGCVVRICDIIAYLGKDRQDAVKAGLLSPEEDVFEYGVIGRHNAEIINNLSVNIIENSYGKPYIKMSREYFEALREAKRSNYHRIYLSDDVAKPQNEVIRPMFCRLYEKLVRDIKENNTSSPIFAHHIAPIEATFYKRDFPYTETDPDTIVCDYIASMTDDYFVWLHGEMFPHLPTIEYKSYSELNK
ncbi:MAG: HD domain-containing protein [Clostridia bacterium]|nr:HD domain-containing protein [Clostridia bacterium]